METLVAILDFFNKYASLVEAFCVSVSAVYAVLLYRHTTIASKRLAVTQMLREEEHDKELFVAEQKIRRLYKENKSSLKAFVEVDGEERAAILLVLNHYEFIAGGINMGTFDEDVYKRAQYSNIMRTWNMTSDFIETLRANRGNTTYFQEFKVMACRWKREKLESLEE